ncbi:MAG: FG-GAP repeat protein [Chitinophagaceae bacterium]|nr:FG-GAP repeat protein [Chitinophagaceae bacterium]
MASAAGINTTATAILKAIRQISLVILLPAGDINGDGFSDVIVGAWFYDNGQLDEGAAFLFHGSASGINTSVAATLECNQPDARMGRAVSSAGDVNGDGYSDVIVGAYQYTNGQSNEGSAFVYHGSGAGINTTAAAVWKKPGRCFIWLYRLPVQEM